MNSRGSWEGISNASPAGSACCVYGLLCKTDSSLRMLISSRLSSLCEAITLPKPQAPNFFSFNTTQHSRGGKHTHAHPRRLCQLEWLIIDVKPKPWWLLHMYTSGEGRSLVLPMWHCQTTSPGCLTGAGSWNFLDLHQGHWTGYHALWSHTLSPADWEDACLLSPSRCWQVPLTATWSPGAAVTANRATTPSQTRLY